MEGTLQALLAGSGLVDGVQDVDALRPTIRRVDEGTVLCQLDERADRLWVVVSGSVAVRRGPATVTVRGRGDVLGELGLLREAGRRSASLVVVNGPAEVMEITRKAITGHGEGGRIWRNLAALVANKLDEATGQRERFAEQLTEAHELLRLYVGDQALSQRRIAPEEFLRGHQRVRAVIWFSDVVGFSQHVDNMPPERAADFVQQFLVPQVHAIHGRDGCVDKFIGDAVMAYWVVRGADAEEECAAAFEAAVESIREVRRIAVGAQRLALRIGIHLGDAAAGSFGTSERRQYTLLGCDVNKAARLEQCRDEGLAAIRCSAAVVAALPDQLRKTLRGPVSLDLKGVGKTDAYTTDPNAEGEQDGVDQAAES